MTSTACPPEDDLVRMVEGALRDQSLAALEAHVDGCERCAAVIAGLGALDSAAARPRRVGRYQLDRRIGGGGMGEVWAAWDPQLRRDVAIKLVRPERADDDRERERLLREARALARLGHPNVLAVYDVGELDGEVFIATELVAGDTLASRGGAGADWRELARLYAQAARGLAAAHAAGLVHRDVKPANLLLGTDGRVRVADFGLAVRTPTPTPPPAPLAPTERAATGAPSEPSVSITQSGYIAGTPGYMAPEQRLGEPADARADQFALCVALTEAIGGRRPPFDVDAARLTAFVAERRPREPDLDRLCTVLARGLAIDRDARYPDADALAAALEATIAAPDAADDRGAAAGRRPTRPRRARTLAISVAAVAALAAAGVVIAARVRGTGASVASTSPDGTDGTDGTMAARAGSAGAASSADDDVHTDGTPSDTVADGVSAPAHATSSGSAEAARGRADLAALAGSGATDRATGIERDPSTSTSTRPGAVAVPPVRIPGAIGTPPPPTDTRPPRTATTPPAATLTGDDATQVELALAGARRALLRRDAKACVAALAAIPARVPVMTAHTVALHRGQCEMLAGECARGITRVDAALEGIGSPAAGAGFALQYCPVTGPFATRLARFTTQVNLLREDAAGCKRYLAAAERLATDARAAGVAAEHKTNVAMGLRQLARCISAADCARAHALWGTAADLDGLEVRADLAASCPPPAARPTAASTAAAQLAAASAAVTAMQTAVQQRDLRACRAQLKALPTTIPAGYETSVLLMRGTCEMMLGDCATGQQHVVEAYGPRQAATATAMANIYCPITGSLDERLRRMASQAGAFTGAGGTGIAWCDGVAQHARAATSEVQTDAHRRSLARTLQQVAGCLGHARRCDEARDLWQLASTVHASTPPTPALPSTCP